MIEILHGCKLKDTDQHFHIDDWLKGGAADGADGGGESMDSEIVISLQAQRYDWN